MLPLTLGSSSKMYVRPELAGGYVTAGEKTRRKMEKTHENAILAEYLLVYVHMHAKVHSGPLTNRNRNIWCFSLFFLCIWGFF